MKFTRNVALVLGLISSTALANEIVSPLGAVQVTPTESSTLSIQNLSAAAISLVIYDDTVELQPASGIQYECKGYAQLELQIQQHEHDYFEVPCQSKVVFTEAFHSNARQGK